MIHRFRRLCLNFRAIFDLDLVFSEERAKIGFTRFLRKNRIVIKMKRFDLNLRRPFYCSNLFLREFHLKDARTGFLLLNYEISSLLDLNHCYDLFPTLSHFGVLFSPFCSSAWPVWAFPWKML